jgi:hypothetical protein
MDQVNSLKESSPPNQRAVSFWFDFAVGCSLSPVILPLKRKQLSIKHAKATEWEM